MLSRGAGGEGVHTLVVLKIAQANCTLKRTLPHLHSTVVSPVVHYPLSVHAASLPGCLAYWIQYRYISCRETGKCFRCREFLSSSSRRSSRMPNSRKNYTHVAQHHGILDDYFISNKLRTQSPVELCDCLSLCCCEGRQGCSRPPRNYRIFGLSVFLLRPFVRTFEYITSLTPNC